MLMKMNQMYFSNVTFKIDTSDELKSHLVSTNTLNWLS